MPDDRRRRIGDLIKRLTGEQTLLARVVTAGFWAVAARFAARGITTIRAIILARLLSPENWGLYSVALLAMLLLERFSQTGVGAALVQRSGDIRGHLNTAWTMEFIRNSVISVALFAGAPLAASLLGGPDAEPLIRVVALGTLLNGFTNIGTVYLERDLDFKRFSVLQLSQRVAEVVVSIVLAFILGNAFALAFGVVAGNAARVVASYVLHPHRPRFELDLAKAKELYSFGVWLFFSAILNYLNENADDIVVSRVVGVVGLGLYRMAFNLSQAVATEIGNIVNQVAFPAYSSVQSDEDRVKKGLVGHVHMIALISTPIAFGTIAVAEPLTRVLLGEQWLGAIAAMQILSVTGLLRTLGVSVGAMFHGLGRPDIPTRLRFVKLAVLLVAVYPLTTRFGIEGAAIATVVAAASIDSFTVVKAFRFAGVQFSQAHPALTYPLGIGAVMLAGVFLVDAMWQGSGVVELAGLVAVGALLYVGGIVMARKWMGYDLVDPAIEKLKGIGGSDA